MPHAKTDSEVTSIAPSSPPRSPARRPAYYVQSPSHDGEKTTTASFHSTPVISPSGSPPHSQSSVGRHSRESSTSRFSGSLNKSKVAPNDRRSKGGKRCDAIEEEGLLDDEGEGRRALIPRRCYFPVFVLAFAVLFSFFALILWGASRSQRPQISIKSIQFENFIIQSGTDASMVPTDMATLNSTVKLTFRNTGSFFGVHVTSAPIDISYYQLSLATGNINNFYQSRKSQRTVSVSVTGNKVPLYGSGAGMSSAPPSGAKGGPAAAVKVNLTLSVGVRATAYVLGSLVKPEFYSGAQCSVVMDPNPNKLNAILSLDKSCQYDD